jgi:hypothetical protein
VNPYRLREACSQQSLLVCLASEWLSGDPPMKGRGAGGIRITPQLQAATDLTTVAVIAPNALGAMP